MVNVTFDVKNRGVVQIQLKEGRRVIDEESLTVSQDFDSMLIRGLDKLLAKNNIERLLIKNVKIAGKMHPTAISAMVLKTVVSALGV